MKRIYLSLIVLGIANVSLGQIGSTVLDYNNTAAHVSDGGILFNNLSGFAGYEIPKDSNLFAIYTAGLWYAGTDVNGQLKMSATRFTPGSDIFPGPIANAGEYTSSAYLASYSPSIWSVDQDEIDYHILNYAQPGYVAAPSIVDWPGNGDASIGISQQLAPYQDLNSNGIYEPLLGDSPLIRGHKATYVIMNDAAQVHVESGGNVIGIEVHLMLYQYATNDVLNDVTFVHSTVFNRGTQTLYDFRCSLYSDGDLGNYSDDFMGSDSLLNMIFTYNGDAFDADYGENPPAIGIMSLNEEMDGAGYFSNGLGFPYSDPTTGAEYWNLMNNLWADGSPWVSGGMGYAGSPGASAIPTNFLFSGDPLDTNQWSEVSSYNASGDRRMIMNMPKEVFTPGAYRCIDFAVVHGRDTLGPLSSVADLKINAEAVQDYYDLQNYVCDFPLVGIEESIVENYSIHPNPSNGMFNVQFEEEIAAFNLRVVDLSGRTLLDKNYKNKTAVSVELHDAAGIYVLLIETANGIHTERILVK